MLLRQLSPRGVNPVVGCLALALLAVLVGTARVYAADKIFDGSQETLITESKTSFADTPQSLLNQLREVQTELAIGTPPGLDRPLHLPYGMMSFDPLHALPPGHKVRGGSLSREGGQLMFRCALAGCEPPGTEN